MRSEMTREPGFATESGRIRAFTAPDIVLTMANAYDGTADEPMLSGANS